MGTQYDSVLVEALEAQKLSVKLGAKKAPIQSGVLDHSGRQATMKICLLPKICLEDPKGLRRLGSLQTFFKDRRGHADPHGSSLLLRGREREARLASFQSS